jgi:dTDP-4-dehydrorhamnose 3,5-epimerase
LSFKLTPLSIPEVILVEPDTYSDGRGFFRETYKKSVFAESGIFDEFTQGNLSLSSRGVMRGLHYQKDPSQVAKLVSAARGSLFDVAVDVRPGPTFGKWVGYTLTSEGGEALYVPRGFAHGFLALEDDTIASYLMAGEFDGSADAGVRFDDPAIGIEWPFEPTVVSDKDREQPLLSEVTA